MSNRASVERIEHDGRLHAMVIRSSFRPAGIEFVTPPEFTQQLAVMNHPRGKRVAPHSHKPLPTLNPKTQEVLIVRRGRVRLDLFASTGERIGSADLGAGDIILLIEGGHGLEVLEDCDVVEVKPGPYLPGGDKILLPQSAD